MSKLKLLKLMYLAERESLKRRGYPMIYDNLVCMKHGPVLSRTYNMIDYRVRKQEEGWQLTRPRPYNVRLESKKARVDHLSENDLIIIDNVWGRFGHMTQWELRDYTHGLPEYTHPGNTSVGLSYLTVLQKLGLSNADFLADEIEFASAWHESSSAI